MKGFLREKFTKEKVFEGKHRERKTFYFSSFSLLSRVASPLLDSHGAHMYGAQFTLSVSRKKLNIECVAILPHFHLVEFPDCRSKNKGKC